MHNNILEADIKKKFTEGVKSDLLFTNNNAIFFIRADVVVYLLSN